MKLCGTSALCTNFLDDCPDFFFPADLGKLLSFSYTVRLEKCSLDTLGLYGYYYQLSFHIHVSQIIEDCNYDT